MDSIARYIFEAGMLKRTARSGWWAEKVDNPESVADHSFRAAVVAFMLAKMEGLDDAAADRICVAAVFHDMHEARLGDMNKITARYIHMTRELEEKVEKEQAQAMPAPIQNAVLGTQNLSEKEHGILKDADYLECAFQAKEYLDIGHRGAGTWIKNIGEKLRTKSAKRLHAQMKRMDSNSWWKGLKRLD
jgi:putative hydrolase of HD superfamily